MKIAIISIGDELLSGFTLNSNFAWMGQELLKSGIIVSKQITVGDNLEQIRLVLDKCVSTVDVILMTGGLGPTHDDITSTVLYQYFKDKPELVFFLLRIIVVYILLVITKINLPFQEFVSSFIALITEKNKSASNSLSHI